MIYIEYLMNILLPICIYFYYTGLSFFNYELLNLICFYIISYNTTIIIAGNNSK